MIPLPRPAVPYGACQDCGRRHDGECQLAESERNREKPEPHPHPATRHTLSMSKDTWVRWMRNMGYGDIVFVDPLIDGATGTRLTASGADGVG